METNEVAAPAAEEGSLVTDLPQAEPEAGAIEVEPEVDLENLPEWLHQYKEVGADVLGDPSLKLVDSNEKLLKGYVHAQKSIGANKVVVPNKHAEWDGPEWTEVFHKLGLPQNLEDYALKPTAEGEDDEFLKSYKDIAMKEKLLPHQAQAVYEWYRGKADEGIASERDAEQNNLVKEQQALREEWGDKYDRNLQLAQIAVRSVDDPGFMEYLEQSGLASNAKLIKAFAKLGQSMNEEAGIVDGGTTSPLQNSKDSATTRLAEIYEDPKNPIYHKTHPAHDRIRNEVRQLHLRKNM